MSNHFKPVLPGFEHVKRFWDNQRQKVVAKVLPGEFYVSKTDELITTVLGSCIAACIYDEGLGIGGMNHFMLPMEKGVDPANAHSLNCRYGNWAMEYLINEILKNGASKRNLKVKLFGGGKIIRSMTDIGVGNIRFANAYILEEGLDLVSHDVGGPWPRKVLFNPQTGSAQVKKMRELHSDKLEKREIKYLHDIEHQDAETNIELF
ncbi:chemoreceptor glutamine deamidase CheD [Pseudoalteromonas sp. MEBiC 03607]|jgi:chemotaxis protein CheD|uniref:chemoreceptor glutamine deamidase CheD n=1 Tax=Pseudoalteromonas TaxID=53246 RepID=UPI000C4EBADA|nr:MULTISPECIES: chemoreceptor glutamine deamidase CheD [unclassified Pseudoalteromonas]MBU77164.1 chemotaxis protein CheD [Pseudoalteromonadaceae bacterium]HCV03157.1 chemoreceptor glutamine deamidase CheD [Pseudoalteromonas sp.]MCF2900480.1 chemoreceptor glutamine deamidase CheD [Pseudoalteromonas sp. OFAV1]MCF2920105.1 chemoreceptor glutamine deamidase CheD [Pseudoalteromonas sp. APAL1]TGV18788.1 chemoreceptor glutamine deamidase CheD [Pseudoalteromonas sp. MEBiC 03607]|tara:strand:+ start:3256 stop:3873 length:618 start_codon:yes stop_codon:yes gene_type:complete